MTQPVQYFNPGERVQLTQQLSTIPVGTHGTILMQFFSSPLYDVRFDGISKPRIVPGQSLVLLPPKAGSPDRRVK